MSNGSTSWQKQECAVGNDPGGASGAAVMVNLFGRRLANPPGGGEADAVAKYSSFDRCSGFISPTILESVTSSVCVRKPSVSKIFDEYHFARGCPGK